MLLKRFLLIALISLLIHPSMMIDPHALHMTLPTLLGPPPILLNTNDDFRTSHIHPSPQILTHPGHLLHMRLVQDRIL